MISNYGIAVCFSLTPTLSKGEGEPMSMLPHSIYNNILLMQSFDNLRQVCKFIKTKKRTYMTEHETPETSNSGYVYDEAALKMLMERSEEYLADKSMLSSI